MPQAVYERLVIRLFQSLHPLAGCDKIFCYENPVENAFMKLTQRLIDDYQQLFNSCMIRDSRIGEVTSAADQIHENRSRYEEVAENLGLPWFVIGVIHLMEASLNFTRHLHNGDPLTGRTVHVPKGRPRVGNPPFTWEESATDALLLEKMDRWSDWTVPGTLYKLEAYNGWGYRKWHPEVLSPYLWSGSNHYTSGKYVADGTFSNTAVSRQVGAAVVLRRMVEMGLASFEAGSAEILPSQNEPLLRYAPSEKNTLAAELQSFLNTLPGIYVKVDGYAGEKTSNAFKKATGYYLFGDVRANENE